MDIQSLISAMCFTIPIVILFIGPSDAIAWSIIDGRPLRTWHYEQTAMAAVLTAVAVATGDSLAGVGMILLAQSGRSIGTRMVEAMMRMPGGRQWLEAHVDCIAWARYAMWASAGAGALYFASRGAMMGLYGIIVDIIYRHWRAWYTRRLHP